MILDFTHEEENVINREKRLGNLTRQYSAPRKGKSEGIQANTFHQFYVIL